LIVVVDKPLSLLSIFTPDYDYVVQSWVQVTHIGLDAITDPTQMVAWATRPAHGAPLPGVQVALQPGSSRRRPTPTAWRAITVQIAGQRCWWAAWATTSPSCRAPTSYWDDSGWTSYGLTDELRWYVFDDRAMYRPGEEVHVKGFVRHIGYGPTAMSAWKLAGTA
jgi:uncharacterized protein YfaS (alpha-2-macroglobulin family)